MSSTPVNITSPIRDDRCYTLVVTTRAASDLPRVATELNRHGRIILSKEPVVLTFSGPASVGNSASQLFSWVPYENVAQRGDTFSTLLGMLRSRGNATGLAIWSIPMSSLERAAVFHTPFTSSSGAGIGTSSGGPSLSGALGQLGARINDAVEEASDLPGRAANTLKWASIAIGVTAAAVLGSLLYVLTTKTGDVARITGNVARVAKAAA